MGRTRDGSERRATAEKVFVLRNLVDDYLVGKLDRSELARRARAREDTGKPRDRVGIWGEAGAVSDGLTLADELVPGVQGPEMTYVLRDSDIRAYRRWLWEGAKFFGDEEPLAGLGLTDTAFFELVGVEPVRWWFQGLGWAWSLEFCSPATGRTFGAMGMIEREEGGQIELRKAIHDPDPLVALADALETLDLAPEVVKTDLDLAAVASLSRY